MNGGLATYFQAAGIHTRYKNPEVEVQVWQRAVKGQSDTQTVEEESAAYKIWLERRHSQATQGVIDPGKGPMSFQVVLEGFI